MVIELGGMPREIRVEPIFRDDTDRKGFLATFAVTSAAVQVLPLSLSASQRETCPAVHPFAPVHLVTP